MDCEELVVCFIFDGELIEEIREVVGVVLINLFVNYLKSYCSYKEEMLVCLYLVVMEYFLLLVYLCNEDNWSLCVELYRSI